MESFFPAGTKLSAEVEFKAQPSVPVRPSPSPEGTIGKDIQPPEYQQSQHDTWHSLYSQQEKLLAGNVCDEYLAGRKALHYTAETIPKLADLSNQLERYTGWRIIRVEGYVPEPIFFKMLSHKLFPSTDFIRHPHELEYTPAPDMFHDLMGHLPMITNPRFASFFQKIGQATVNAKDEEDIAMLGRIYWFTVEFGVINPTVFASKRDPKACRIYGAGIVSSVGEIPFSLSDKVPKVPFDIDVVAKTKFDIHHMQEQVFEIESFDQLEADFDAWAKRNKLL